MRSLCSHDSKGVHFWHFWLGKFGDFQSVTLNKSFSLFILDEKGAINRFKR
jgi:hypothetical protein